jgi:predicted dehydrogenase
VIFSTNTEDNIMGLRKEYSPKAFNFDQRFNYLGKDDRFVLSRENPKYKFNVIGCGLNGNEHIYVTMLEGKAAILGIYDSNPKSIEFTQETYASLNPDQELVVYDTLEAVCNDPDADALIITTPNYTHLEILQEAVKSGKHILLEKPMATKLDDAKQILKLAEDYPGVFQVGLQYRFKPIYVETIHEVFERKSIGDVKLINIAEYRMPFLDKVNQWNKFSKYSGGTLVEKCCHYFDLMNIFANSTPVSVYASGGSAVNFKEFEYQGEKSDIIDNAFVCVDYENNVRGSFNLSMFVPMFYEEITLCGDAGYLKAYEKEDFLGIPQPLSYLEVIRGETEPSRFSYPSYPAYIQESGHSGATYFEHVNFIDNIEGKQTNTATVEEGFWSVAVGIAAEKSIKTGQIVNMSDLIKAVG